MARSSSLTASIFGGLLLFGGGYVFYDYSVSTVFHGPDMTIRDYIAD